MAKFPYHVTFNGIVYPPNTEVPVDGGVTKAKDDEVKTEKKKPKKKVEE